MPSIQDIQNQLIGLRNQYSTQQGGEGLALQAMSDYARTNNLDPNMIATAASNVGQTPWNVNRVQQTMAQYGPTSGNQYGLNPAMQNLNQGAMQANQRVNQTQGQVSDIYKQGLSYLNPYMQSGQSANDLQAALSGAMGPEVQKQAYLNYQQSPGVQFAQQEAERALLRNASATGGLGGGNVLRDLTQLAAGTYMQDYNNQFGQIGQVADRGYGAATTGAGLQGQQAQVQSGLGQFAANIPLQASQQGAGYQFQAGRDIGTAVGNTTSALSSLINQQGAGMTDITGNATNNLATLYQNAMNGDANAKEQLAAMLGNLSSGASSQVSSLPIIQGQTTNYLGQMGQIAGGIGGLASGLGYGNQPAQATITGAGTQLPQNQTPGVYGPGIGYGPTSYNFGG